MHNILIQARLEILLNIWVILSIVAGVIAIAAILLILSILKRRRLKKPINLDPSNAQEADKWSGENYKLITKRIKRAGRKNKCILFASVEQDALPITIPVNAAIGLAKGKRRCLLIDVDLSRDAIAKVFELEENKDVLDFKAVGTEFENLWVWPAHNFAQLKQMNVNEIVKKAVKKFDSILINAPSLVGSPDRRQIISTAQAVFICTQDAFEIAQLIELIKPLKRKVIGYIQIQRVTA